METEFLNREQLMDSAAAAQNIIEASLSLLTHSSADENQQLAGSLLLDLLRCLSPFVLHIYRLWVDAFRKVALQRTTAHSLCVCVRMNIRVNLGGVVLTSADLH